MIPKTMSFFWSYGIKLSYLRYLSLATARMLHPDWNIVLYQSDWSKQALAWNFHEFQSKRSKAHDWSKEVDSVLHIPIQTYQPSDPIVLQMPPPNQSDIFSYEMLYKHGGWYADMDVIFVKNFDFISDQPYAFIGFGGLDDWVGIFGARQGSWVMQTIYDKCISNFSTDSYNSTGTFGILRDCSSNNEWQNKFQAGDDGLKNWRAPKEMFYPVRNGDTAKLWGDQYETPRPNTWTVHLFGGNQDYALMNKKITPEYLYDTKNNEWICRYIRENRCGLFPQVTPVDPVIITPPKEVEVAADQTVHTMPDNGPVKDVAPEIHPDSPIQSPQAGEGELHDGGESKRQRKSRVSKSSAKLSDSTGEPEAVQPGEGAQPSV